jgi:hypothetical protein
MPAIDPLLTIVANRRLQTLHKSFTKQVLPDETPNEREHAITYATLLECIVQAAGF